MIGTIIRRMDNAIRLYPEARLGPRGCVTPSRLFRVAVVDNRRLPTDALARLGCVTLPDLLRTTTHVREREQAVEQEAKHVRQWTKKQGVSLTKLPVHLFASILLHGVTGVELSHILYHMPALG